MPIALKSNINLEYKAWTSYITSDTWSDILTYTEDDLEAIYKKELILMIFRTFLCLHIGKIKLIIKI